MKQGLNKDWTDAVREKALSGGAAPSPVSWEAVGRRVRRAAAFRRTVLSAAVVLPLMALLLFLSYPLSRHKVQELQILKEQKLKESYENKLIDI